MSDQELQDLSEDVSVEFCYIRKDGAYYRPAAAGYTNDVLRAGVYPKEEALKHSKGCRDLFLVPINIIEHNKKIHNEIEDLKTRHIDFHFGKEVSHDQG